MKLRRKTLFNRQRTATPTFIEIQAVWEEESDSGTAEGNVLGGYGALKMVTGAIHVPSTIADQAYLNYYGCKLYTVEDVLSFEADEVFPLTIMSVGENHAKDYIMKSARAYLEYHDIPHFHMPLTKDSKGHIMLEKKLLKDKKSPIGI